MKVVCIHIESYRGSVSWCLYFALRWSLEEIPLKAAKDPAAVRYLMLFV